EAGARIGYVRAVGRRGSGGRPDGCRLSAGGGAMGAASSYQGGGRDPHGAWRRGGWRRRGGSRRVGMSRRFYVSLSGVDGAGKSTLIEALRRDLAEDHRVEVLWNPLEFWGQAVLNKLPDRLRTSLGQGRPVKLTGRSGPSAPQEEPQQRRTAGRALGKLFWYVI